MSNNSTIAVEEQDSEIDAEAGVIEVEVEIEGIYDLLLRNGRTSNPIDPFAKAIKTLSSKRSKTDEDHETLGRVEWWSSLYLSKDAKVDVNGLDATAPADARVVIPADVLSSCLSAGARKLKLGKDVSAGVLVLDDALLNYRGPKDVNALARDPEFRFAKCVKVGAARIMRTRPKFAAGWSLTFTVQVQADILDPSRIRDCIEAAGKYIGIGDWRPGAPRGGPFGRFIVKRCVIK